MPIEVACVCGKRLRAKDELAGRRAKCPGCGNVLQIPAAKVAAPPPPPVEADAYHDPFQAAVDSYNAGEPSNPSVVPENGSPIAMAPAPVVKKTAFKGHSFHDMVKASGGSMETAGGAKRAPAKRTAPMELPSEDGFKGIRRFTYLVLLVAMLPLAAATFGGSDGGVREAFRRTLKEHPELKEDFAADDRVLTMKQVEQVIKQTPDDRLDGALLPRTTWNHWGFALLSAAFFLGTAIFVMPARGSKLAHVFLTGLFTGTVGIFLLLAVQFIAHFTGGFILRGNVFIMLIFYILKFIGFSYRCAMDPRIGFAGSFFGFTFGVGLCEELCKAIPVLWKANRGNLLDWRTACQWGFLSGVGFGVSEGISYAADYYNGLMGGQIYLVRFISCVALHGVWSAAAGIMIYRHQDALMREEHWSQFLLTAAALVAVPMVLHGLYDTLLKRDMHVEALAVAVLSFGYLAFQIEKTHRKEMRIIAAM